MKQIDPKEVDLINEHLEFASPMGACCIGMACCEAWSNNLKIDRSLIEGAGKCVTVREGADLVTEWLKTQPDCISSR